MRFRAAVGGGSNAGSLCRIPAIVDSAPNARSNFEVTPSAPKAATSAVITAEVVLALSPVAGPMVPSVCRIQISAPPAMASGVFTPTSASPPNTLSIGESGGFAGAAAGAAPPW